MLGQVQSGKMKYKNINNMKGRDYMAKQQKYGILWPKATGCRIFICAP